MPESLDLSRQVHAIPAKRSGTKLVDWLEQDELKALLETPGPQHARRGCAITP